MRLFPAGTKPAYVHLPVLMIALGAACHVRAQDTVEPLAQRAEWPMERVHLKSGTVHHGLVQLDQPTKIEFVEVVRPQGKPMYLVIRPISKTAIAQVQRLSEDERTVLAKRIHRFIDRVRIEAEKMEHVVLRRGGQEGQNHWQYDGDWFSLSSTADDHTTRRCVIRIEQIFRAYRQLLPPKVSSGSRTLAVSLFGSTKEYRDLLRELGLSIHNPAFYSPQTNQIIAASELSQYARRLQENQAYHEKLRRQYDALDAGFPLRLATYSRELSAAGLDQDQIRDELNALRAAWGAELEAVRRRINSVQRNNESFFSEVTQVMFRRLYHEAFHAYLENYVYPRSEYDIPRWLNEGLAQIFEGGQFEAGTLRIDAPDRDLLLRLQGDLRSRRPLGLMDVLTTDDTSFLITHGDGNRSSIRQYLYSWGLAWYLTYDRHLLRSPALDAYVSSEASRLSPTARFSNLVGMPLEQFERQWRRRMLKVKASLPR